MQFSEAMGGWQEIPPWADFLISFGFNWPESEPEVRRIALISMPTDSAAAGLIALGAMRRRLESATANDLDSHYQRLERLARQGNHHTQLRFKNERSRYVTDCLDKAGFLWVKEVNSKNCTRRSITPASAAEWRFCEEAPVKVSTGDRIPYGNIYSRLASGGTDILPSNLTQSDSSLCLSGRVAGETVTRNIVAAIKFKANDTTADLTKLLTIQSWAPNTISRVSFFNARTGQLDRGAGRTCRVIADGDKSFLRAVDNSDFQYSDIIGVIHRTVERERLEELGAKLASLDQWYDRDLTLLEALPSRPKGISVIIMRRR